MEYCKILQARNNNQILGVWEICTCQCYCTLIQMTTKVSIKVTVSFGSISVLFWLYSTFRDVSMTITFPTGPNFLMTNIILCDSMWMWYRMWSWRLVLLRISKSCKRADFEQIRKEIRRFGFGFRFLMKVLR